MLWRRRYWNDPDVLKKLGTAMGDMPVPGATANGHAEGQAAAADGEEGAEEDEEATVHSAASTGARPSDALQTWPTSRDAAANTPPTMRWSSVSDLILHLSMFTIAEEHTVACTVQRSAINCT